MLSAAIGRLNRLPHRRSPERRPTPARPAQATVYIDAAVIVGELIGSLPRASDPLAALTSISLRDAVATRLSDGVAGVSADRVLGPDEIVAVATLTASLPGGPSRRHRVTLRTGPYYVEGYVGAVLALDLLANLRHRSRLDLTDAALEYVVAGRLRRDRLPALSVNRLLVESIAEAREPDGLQWMRR